MGKRTPLIDTAKPVKEYDLDDPSAQHELGISKGDPAHPCKISDRYTIYSNGKRAIIEFKRSNMHKAVEQLDSSAHLLVPKNPVDFLIVVSDGLSRTESRFFKQELRTHRLVDPSRNDEPYRVKVAPFSWELLIFYEEQVDNMYRMYKNLSGDR
ncbi:MAG: hypothetical protein ABSB28_01340 [Candidatus Bathyarchaeia archaeon]